MEDPVKEISGVIHLLTQSPPSIQRETIETYFTPDAAFTHPFCRTGSWDRSRVLIRAVYRWYKILSPGIEMEVRSIAFDEPNLTLYVTFTQLFGIFIIPFHRARVSGTSVITLRLDHADQKYYIAAQNDLYQVDEFVKFVLPPAWMLVWVWHVFATLFCLFGAVLLAPVSWAEEVGWVGATGVEGSGERRKERVNTRVKEGNGMKMKDLERRKGKVGEKER